MDVYSQIAVKIISSQEAIIGPVAVEQAQRVDGLNVDWKAHKVSIEGNGVKILDELIAQYHELFGQISIEVCKEAASSLIDQLPADGLPKALAA